MNSAAVTYQKEFDPNATDTDLIERLNFALSSFKSILIGEKST